MVDCYAGRFELLEGKNVFVSIVNGGLVPSLNCKTDTLASAQGETECISKLYKFFCGLGYLTSITYSFHKIYQFWEAHIVNVSPE